MSVRWSNVAVLALLVVALWVWKNQPHGSAWTWAPITPRPWDSEVYRFVWWCAALIALVAIAKLATRRPPGGPSQPGSGAPRAETRPGRIVPV